MREIDIENWPRKEHFRLYNRFEFPHTSICVQIDITDQWSNRKQIGASPTIALVYVITKAANRIPELKQRIRGERLIEHDLIHPMIAVMGKDDLFGVAALTYNVDFETFTATSTARLAKAVENASLSEFPHDKDEGTARDDLLSITLLPWLSFTSFNLTRQPKNDCIPLLAVGKVVEHDERYLLPFFVNFHHAVADGLHVAKFVKYIEEESQILAGVNG